MVIGDKMTLQELIAIFREKYQLSLNDIAEHVGVNVSTVSRWENGIVKNITKDKQDALSNLFDIDVPDYLAHHFYKPVVGVVKAGYDYFAHQDIESYEPVSKYDYDRSDYFLRVKGDSMTGSRIYENDLILVQKVSDVESGELAVVIINGDEATVKRVVKKENMLILEASNPSYETRYFTKEEVETLPVQIIGKVMNVKMKIS